MLVNTSKMFEKALKGKYAIPAFNVSNLETVKAVVNVANELKKDTIISVSESAINYSSAETIASIVKSLASKSKTNFALHLDHGKDFEICKKAVDAGFTSVMIDGSSLAYKDNVKLTKKVVDYAHKFNVTVEGELGKILGTEDMISSNQEHFTDAVEAKDFVNKTGVDSLAISIGTAHGINKGSKNPEIQFDVIENVHNAIINTPLVAHGSSTVPKNLVENINKQGGNIKKSQGISEEIITKMAHTAICKINIDTDLRLAFTSGLRESLNKNPEVFDPRKYLSDATKETEKQIKHIFNLLN